MDPSKKLTLPKSSRQSQQQGDNTSEQHSQSR